MDNYLLEPYSALITVTPELAKKWIETPAQYQRSVSKQRVDEYANLMIRGEWKPTQIQQIGISIDNQIVDGQHRCQAVVKAGIPIKMWVCFNCPSDVFDVIDRGMGRTKAQIASMSQCKYSRPYHIGSINTLLWEPQVTGSANNQWTVNESIQLLNGLEYQLGVVFPQGYSGSKNYLSASFRGACLRALLCRPYCEQQILDFVKTIASGESFSGSSITNSPMPNRLRLFLERQAKEGASVIDRWTTYYTSIKALRHTLDGTECKKESLKVREVFERNLFPIKFSTFPVGVKEVYQQRQKFSKSLAPAPKN